MKTMLKALRRVWVVLCGLFCAFLLWGCSTLAIIPTAVPPLLDTLIEGETPHVDIKGVKITLQGIVDARMKYADTLYPVVREFYNTGREASKQVSNTILGLLSAAGLAGTGALPLALRAIPKHAISKEEHEAKVKQAGNMLPHDFNKA